MIVYIIQLDDMKWSSKQQWGEFPDIYPTFEAAEKILKSTPAKQSKPRFNAYFWGHDEDKIEIVPYKFEKV